MKLGPEQVERVLLHESFMKQPTLAISVATASIAMGAGACDRQKETQLHPEVSSHEGAVVQAQVGPNAARPGTSRPLSCYKRAQDDTLLNESDAFMLCRGAETAGPVECFERADGDTTLENQLVFELCRCARSTEPVDCYLRSQDSTFLAKERIVALCSPIATRNLNLNCTTVN